MDSHVIYELYLAAEHVTEPVRLRQLAATRLPVIACDTETTGLDPHGSAWLHGCKQSWLVHNRIMPFGISLAFPLEDKVALCWARRGTVLWFAALDVLACPTRKTWHNARYDMRVCQDNGIALNGEQDDTLTMSRIWWDRRKAHGLEALTEMLCPHLCEWKRKFDREWRRLQSYCTRHKRPEGWCNYSLMPDELVGEYAKVDAFMGLVVWSRLWPQVGGTELYRREMRVLRAILEVEKRGLAFDAGKARGLAREMRKRIRTCKQNLPVGMKPGSPASVLAYLLAAGANKDKLRVKGKLTTGVEVLRELLIEQAGTPVASLVQDVLEYRALTKTVNTYLVKLADLAERQDGIIYTTINPADTKTSRMTSSAPNLENIPKLRPRGSELDEDNPTRSCFGPRLGATWYLFDYVQMELAMFGWYTQDEFICHAYGRGEDLHLAMAKRIYGEDCTPNQRTLSKNITFGVIFGMQERKLLTYLAIPKKEAQDLLAFYHETFPSIRAFQEEVERRLALDGYVEDFFGKRYTLPPELAYKGVNRLVQGGCAQAFKCGFLAMDTWLNETGAGQILLPIHDEWIVESRLEKGSSGADYLVEEVQERMANIEILVNKGRRFRVDVKVTDSNWAAKESYQKP